MTYRWNAARRKYLPDGLAVDAAEPAPVAAAPAEVPEYTAEMMRFEATAEPVVTLEEAQREEAESAALAEKLQDAKEQGGKVRRSACGSARMPREARGAGRTHGPSFCVHMCVRLGTTMRLRPRCTRCSSVISRVQRAPAEEAAPAPKGKALRTDAATPANANGGTSGSDNAGGKAEWFELKNNTSVYVSGLPEGVTEEEIAAEFSRCGVIKQNDDGTPKIKLYRCAVPACDDRSACARSRWRRR